MRNRILPVIVALAGAALTVTSAGAQYGGIRTAEQVLADAEAYRTSLRPNAPHIAHDGAIVAGHRCATHDLTDAEHAAISARVAMTQALRTESSFEDYETPAEAKAKGKNRINVYFHVVHDGQTGNVPDADIKAQVKVLNREFKRHGFKFKLKGITRTKKKSWFGKCDRSNKERRMTNKLSVDTEKNLNIFLCNPGGGLLGWTYLPGSAVSGTPQDAVILLYSTLPNGTAAPYNLGDTATHEVGHWLGLLHTFQGGCSGSGDFVDDTAPEASPTYGCPNSRDSCAGGGPDNVNNFMNYTDDICMTEFTKGQRQRMKNQVAALRPKV